MQRRWQSRRRTDETSTQNPRANALRVPAALAAGQNPETAQAAKGHFQATFLEKRLIKKGRIGFANPTVLAP